MRIGGIRRRKGWLKRLRERYDNLPEDVAIKRSRIEMYGGTPEHRVAFVRGSDGELKCFPLDHPYCPVVVED